jgi:hypothetical protein
MVMIPDLSADNHKPLVVLVLAPAAAAGAQASASDASLARQISDAGLQLQTVPFGDNASLTANLAAAGIAMGSAGRSAAGQPVWLAGYGVAGQCAARFAVAQIDRIAGLCLVGAQYYGADNSDYELAETLGFRLPVLEVNGLAHPNGLLPYNRSALRPMPVRFAGVTPTDFSLVAGYEEQRFWRKLNHCPIGDLAGMAALQQTSPDACERELGVQFDRTQVRSIGGSVHYIGDVQDLQGQTMLRLVGVVGCREDVPESVGRLLGEFSAEIGAWRQGRDNPAIMKAARENDSFWTTSFPAIGGRTPQECLNIGNSDYRFENFIRGAFAERQRDVLLSWLLYNDDDCHPDLQRHWLRQGLFKELHRCPEPGRTWVSYVPTAAAAPAAAAAAASPGAASRRYPLLFIVYKGQSLMFLETFGFLELAAARQMIVIAARDGNDDANFTAVLETASNLYPVDRGRVYLAGHSFGASVTGRHAVSYADRIAGACLMACQYYGADTTPEEECRAASRRLPVVFIHGTCEIRRLIPLDQDSLIPMPPRNTFGVTTSTMSLVSAHEEQRFWRRINGCATLRLEEMAGCHARATDECERRIGLPLDRSEIRYVLGCRHYIGDIYGEGSQSMIRYIGVEGCPHIVAATAAEQAWSFLNRFARDEATGKLIIREEGEDE